MHDRGARRRWTRAAGWITALGMVAVLAPFAAHLLLQPFRFNQFYLQRLEASHRVISAGTALDALRSAHSSGVAILRDRPRRRAPAWSDTLGMFRYVYGWIPPYAVVYPTEGIYYFRTEMGGRRVAGNVRVADLDWGRLTFAYFDRSTLETVWTTVDSAAGLRVRRLSDQRYRVEFGGRTVLFKIPDTATRPPRRLALLPEEEFVGQVHDESGIRLFLLFNRATDSFYYVLNDEDGTVDRLTDAGSGFLVGRRTGFLFYDDRAHGRKILTGVDVENVLLNTYLDGPADQVPFRARIRDRVFRAYPGMVAGPPIDETGVMRSDTSWARVALAPFNVYSAVPDMVAFLRPLEPGRMPPSVLWSYLTKETWNSPEWLVQAEADLRREGRPMRMPGWMVMRERGIFPDRPAFASRHPSRAEVTPPDGPSSPLRVD